LAREEAQVPDLDALPLLHWRVDYCYTVVEDGSVIVTASDYAEAKETALEAIELPIDADVDIISVEEL